MLEPMFADPGDRGLAPVLIGLGVMGLVFGLAWIRRITRGDDDGPSSWRSRR